VPRFTCGMGPISVQCLLEEPAMATASCTSDVVCSRAICSVLKLADMTQIGEVKN